MKGVVTIAGYGTRFLPASKAIPKEMIPIAGVPLLQLHVESLVAAGIRDVIVVVREGGEVAQRHFGPVPGLEQHLAAKGKDDLLERVQHVTRLANVVFVRQPDTLPYGNGSPALAARPWLDPGEPFYYMFGDDVIVGDEPAPRQLVAAFERFQPVVALAAQQVADDETHLYGCIELKPGSDHEMARVVEKPPSGTAPSNWVQVGHFCFGPELFEVLETLGTGRGGELWLADAVDQLAAHSSVIMQPIEGKWMAAGDPLRHLKASIEVALRKDDMRDDLLEYLRSLDL